MMKKIIYLLLLMFCTMLYNYGQQDEQFTQYQFNPLNFNPAYAGSRGSVNITGIGRFQWVGMEGAPVTQFASIHAPFKNQSIGVGLNIIHDKVGSREKTGIWASFSYSIRLNKKNHRLAFGINGGLDFQQLNFSSLTSQNINDPLKVNILSKAVPNFGAGIYYYGERHYVGFSIPRMLEMDIDITDTSFSTNSSRIQNRHFYLMGGYVFKLNTILDLKVSSLIKLVMNAPITFDLNTNLIFNKKYNLGVMYRFHESVGINFTCGISSWMQIGYSFDMPINDLRLNQWGSHEIILGIDLKTKKQNFISPRYF